MRAFLNAIQARFGLKATMAITSLAILLPVANADAREMTAEIVTNEQLGANAELFVELRNHFGELVAYLELEPGSKRIDVEITNDALSLYAAVFEGGELAFASPTIAIASGTKNPMPTSIELTPVTHRLGPRAYRCGNVAIDVTSNDDELHLRLAARYVELQQTVSASGARFASTGDPTIEFWSKGHKSLLRIDGRSLDECVPDLEATLASLKAQGNEPPWTFEINHGQVLFQKGYGGEQQIDAAIDRVTATGAAQLIKVTNQDLSLEIMPEVARDTMSGMTYPMSVAVNIDGQKLTGTGGDPLRLLRSNSWRVIEISNKPLPQDAEANITFFDGHMAGKSVCNRFFGGFQLTGEGLIPGNMASTRMACPEALDRLERDFFKALGKVKEHRFTDDGDLLLTNGSDAAMVLTPHF